jgi:long-chain acyl-CoA synthetase
LYIVFCAGGSVVYYSGDITKIKDDLSLVKPTIFASVPRLFTRFYDMMQAKLK